MIKKYFRESNLNFRFKILYLIPILLVLLIIDWSTKAWAVSALEYDKTIDSFLPFIKLDLILNFGSAYGVNSGNLGLTVFLATTVTIFIIVLFVFINDKPALIGITLLMGGSLGNLLARAWAPTNHGGPGGVVDFLKFNFELFGANEFVFNIADGWVTFGIISLISAMVYYLIDYIIEVVTEKKAPIKMELRKQYLITKTEILLQREKQWLKSKFVDKFKYNKEFSDLLKANFKQYKEKLISIRENKNEKV